MERADEGVPQRALLCGRGEEILVLVVKESTKLQLKEWLRLPLELSPADAAFLLERNQCCHLRRKGEELLEVVMDRASDEQWCKWLQIPLENAIIAGKTSLVQPLLAAGAGLARAVTRRDSGNGNDAGRGAAAASTSTRDQEASACSASSSSSSSCRGDHLAPASPTSSDARHAAAAAPVATPSSEASSRCPSPDPGLAPRAVSSPSCRSTRGAGCNGSTPGRSASSRPFSSPPPSAPPSTGTESNGCRGRGRGRGAGGPASPREAEVDSLSLHRATMARDSGRMRELLAAGVDRNATDLWCCTALHRAAEQADGCAEHVRLLLAAGLDVRAKDMEGYTPLHFAAARGAETAVVDLIAAESCLAERGVNGDTPLHSAVRFLSLATVRILLESDADEAAVNGDGETPSDVTGVLPDGRDIENQPDPLVAEGIRALLEAAPQERKTRVWKRRGWIVMLRARRQVQAALELAEAARTGGLVLVTTDGVKADATLDATDNNAVAAGGGGGGGPANCCGGGGGGGECGGGERDGSGCAVAAGGCGAGDDAVAESGGFSELVEQTSLLAEEGVFQKVVHFL